MCLSCSRKLAWERNLNIGAVASLPSSEMSQSEPTSLESDRCSSFRSGVSEAMSAEGNSSSVVLFAGDIPLNSLVSEAFVQFFVEVVGHYSLHMNVTEKGERAFQREPFRKSHASRSVRQFLHCFMETQMFAGFIQDRELRKNAVKGEVLL